MTLRWGRRDFVLGALGLALGAVAARLPGRASAGRALSRLPRDRRAARALGRAYLAEHPEEAGRLRALLARNATPLGAGELRARIRRDFEEVRLVRVRGWLLSRTEARLCALVALG